MAPPLLPLTLLPSPPSLSLPSIPLPPLEVGPLKPARGRGSDVSSNLVPFSLEIGRLVATILTILSK